MIPGLRVRLTSRETVTTGLSRWNLVRRVELAILSATVIWWYVMLWSLILTEKRKQHYPRSPTDHQLGVLRLVYESALLHINFGSFSDLQ